MFQWAQARAGCSAHRKSQSGWATSAATQHSVVLMMTRYAGHSVLDVGGFPAPKGQHGSADPGNSGKLYGRTGHPIDGPSCFATGAPALMAWDWKNNALEATGSLGAHQMSVAPNHARPTPAVGSSAVQRRAASTRCLSLSPLQCATGLPYLGGLAVGFCAEAPNRAALHWIFLPTLP